MNYNQIYINCPPSYVLLHRQFVDARPAVRNGKRFRPRILISMGGSDPEDVALGGGVYEVPCHLQPVFKNVHYETNDVKGAHKFCPRHICPPITSGTTESDVAKIMAAVEKYVE